MMMIGLTIYIVYTSVTVSTFHVSVAYWRYVLKWVHPKRTGLAALVQMSMLTSFYFYCKQYPNNSKHLLVTLCTAHVLTQSVTWWCNGYGIGLTFAGH